MSSVYSKNNFMKTKNYILAFKSILYVALIICITIFLQSCSQKITFNNSSLVPAAEGSVKVKNDKNQNYNIDLNVIRLADPQRLNPSKQMYIVWMETDGNGTKNIGQLKTSSSILSKTLKSSLETVSPFKPTKIFITAEDDSNTQYPGGQIVLTTDNF
jgi:hypothetical protein